MTRPYGRRLSASVAPKCERSWFLRARGPWSRPGRVHTVHHGDVRRAPGGSATRGCRRRGSGHVGGLGRAPDRPDPRDRGARARWLRRVRDVRASVLRLRARRAGRAASCVPAGVLPRGATDRPPPACDGDALDTDRHVVHFSHDGGEHRLHYHTVVVAAGGAPVVPPLPGVDDERVFAVRTLEDAVTLRTLLDAGRIGRAIVVGAGYIGLEMVEALHDRGVSVVVAEVAAAGDAEPRRAGCRPGRARGAPPRRRSAARRPARGSQRDGRPRRADRRRHGLGRRGDHGRRGAGGGERRGRGRRDDRPRRCAARGRRGCARAFPTCTPRATASPRGISSSADLPSCRWVRPPTGRVGWPERLRPGATPLPGDRRHRGGEGLRPGGGPDRAHPGRGGVRGVRPQSRPTWSAVRAPSTTRAPTP